MNNLRNSVRLIGNLGMNPEIKETVNHKKLAKFRIATCESYKNNDGKFVNDTTWHNLVAFGNQANIVEKYLKKGSEVAVEGRITNRNYTDKEGVKRSITEILVSEVLMVSKSKA